MSTLSWQVKDPVTGATGVITATLPPITPHVITTKPYCVGLLDRDAQVVMPGGRFDQVIQWTIPEVCPVPGGPIDCTVVKNRMNAADAAGGRHYRGRPQSGVLLNAAWLAAFGMVNMTDPQDLHAFVIPNTANPAYQAEMDRVDAAMSAQLDSDPRLVEIMAIHRFGFEFSNELMIHNPGQASNKTALAAATDGHGVKMPWTEAIDQANILAVVAKLKTWWPTTHPITWCSTFYQNMSKPGLDNAFTDAYATALKAARPDAQIGINNSDLQAYGAGQPDIYAWRKGHGLGSDQTATEAKIGGPTSLVKMFTQPYLATMIAEARAQEMPQGWESDLSSAQILAAQSAFETAHPNS